MDEKASLNRCISTPPTTPLPLPAQSKSTGVAGIRDHMGRRRERAHADKRGGGEMLDLKLITQAPKAGMWSCILGPITPGRQKSEAISKQWR